MEIGVYTFGEVTFDPETSRQLNAQERRRDLIEEIVLADELGLDVFAAGEHHRPGPPSARSASGFRAAESGQPVTGGETGHEEKGEDGRDDQPRPAEPAAALAQRG